MESAPLSGFNAGSFRAVGDHHRDVGANSAGCHRIGNRFKIRAAPGKQNAQVLH